MKVHGTLANLITWIEVKRSNDLATDFNEVLRLVSQEDLLGNRPREDVVLPRLGYLLEGFGPDGTRYPCISSPVLA